MAARKKTAKKKGALSVTRAVISAGERAGRAVRSRIGKPIKPGTGVLAKRRAAAVSSQVAKATGRKKKKAR